MARRGVTVNHGRAVSSRYLIERDSAAITE